MSMPAFYRNERFGLIERLLICFVFFDGASIDQSESGDKSPHSKLDFNLHCVVIVFDLDLVYFETIDGFDL